MVAGFVWCRMRVDLVLAERIAIGDDDAVALLDLEEERIDRLAITVVPSVPTSDAPLVLRRNRRCRRRWERNSPAPGEFIAGNTP